VDPEPITAEPVAAEPLAAEPVDPAPAPATPAVRTQNRIALVATGVVIVALIAGGAFLLGRGTGTPEPAVGGLATASPAPATTIDPSAPVPSVATVEDPYAGIPSSGSRLGSADAPVVVEYWADYQCPFCGKFAQERIPELLPLIEEGRIALVHRDFAFIGPESFDAAVAVRCADREGRYWAMHDAVYAAQDGENQGAFARDRLVAIAESVGLDGDALETCLDDRSMLVAVLDDTSAATRSAIQSTPTVDVNGNRFVGMPELAELEAVIEAAQAGASPVPLPSQVPLDDPWAALSPDGRSAGDASAPVTVDLWLDYQAPEGVAVAGELAEGLRQRVADGRARVVVHDLATLGDESVLAAATLRCIEAQGGPAMLVSEVLSASAQGPGSGIYTEANLLRLAARLGLDIVALDACLTDPATAGAVEAETDAGRNLGLDSAPAIIVTRDGTEVGRFTRTIDPATVLATMDKNE
jgi:protein-disulfide isomerase